MSIFFGGDKLLKQKDIDNLIITRNMACPIPKASGTIKIDINAPKVDGYKFMFWLAPATQGGVRNTYIATPELPITQVWFLNATDMNDCYIHVNAVYIKEIN